MLTEAGGEKPKARIIPFRGEYLELTPEATHLVNHLIYPVPDARFPFLGVHFTKGIDGHVHAGPNAVPAFGRDAYSWTRFRPVDTARFAARPSSWRLAAKHWRTGADEIVRSLRPSKMVAALQRLVPDVKAEDLVPAGAGVRAQAINPDGTLLDDFEIVRCGPLRPRGQRPVARGHRVARHRRVDRPGGRAGRRRRHRRPTEPSATADAADD